MKRKMGNKIIGVLIIIGIMLFSACSSDGGDKENNPLGVLGGGDGGGSSSGGSGITLEFAEGNPPSELFKGQPYTFAFVFKNYQKHDITDLQIKTKGFDKGFVSGLNEKYTVKKLPRATDQAGPGVYSGLIVSGVKLDNFVGTLNFNPSFDYCYTAKSTFREQICVPSKSKNSCDTEFEKSESANGPLKVSIDRVNALDTQVRVDMSIRDTGGGQVVNTCFDDDDYANKYTISDIKLGSTQGKCEAVSDFQVTNRAATFSCMFARNSDDSYASQLTIELTHLYQESLSQKYVVQDPREGLE